MVTKLFVGNLDNGVTEAELREVFGRFGVVENARLVKGAGASNYGFVTFSSMEGAMKAIGEMRHAPFKGRRMFINEALPNEEWFAGPMRDLGLSESQWTIVDGYQKLVVERKLARPEDDARLQALLWYAVDFGSAAHFELLLVAGVNPNMVVPRGYTPLGRVIESAHPPDLKEHRMEIVRLLLQAGADPNQPSERQTPLLIAGKVDTDIVRLLLASGAKASREELDALLLNAAAYGDAVLIRELAAAGAAVNHLGGFETVETPVTALMLACLHGRAEAVAALRAATADVNLRDAQGHTALDYARFTAKTSRRLISLLAQAGAVAGKPFPRPDLATRGFATAAKTPAFKQAVARMQELTGTKPVALIGVDEKIPGGRGFLFEGDRVKNLIEDGAAAVLAVRDCARAFVEQHHSEMLALGAYLFSTRDLTEQNGEALALLPTTDVYRVLAAVQTEGANSDVSNEDLIAWLRELEKDQPYLITGLGADFLEGKFTSPIKDSAALAKRINGICPNEDENSEIEQRQIERLRQSGRLYLWWD